MNEFELIARLTEWEPKVAEGLLMGAGDDCAIISGGGDRDWLVTTDALVEGIHFRREWTNLKLLGRKALSVNLSDIAAMGGVARFYLVTLGLPVASASDIAQKLHVGMKEVASENGVVLIGGDTNASPSGICLSITAIGEIGHGRALLRSGAKPGDAIYVTGSFGSSAIGLCCLKSNCTDRGTGAFIRRHNDPSVRLKEGQWIENSGSASAMIDSSDGLIADLVHIADASGVGFEIDAESVPRDEGLNEIAGRLGEDPIRLALAGGEDYELIFGIRAARNSEFRFATGARIDGCRITRIGQFTPTRSDRIVRARNGQIIKIDRAGFDHFL